MDCACFLWGTNNIFKRYFFVSTEGYGSTSTGNLYEHLWTDFHGVTNSSIIPGYEWIYTLKHKKLFITVRKNNISVLRRYG